MGNGSRRPTRRRRWRGNDDAACGLAWCQAASGCWVHAPYYLFFFFFLVNPSTLIDVATSLPSCLLVVTVTSLPTSRPLRPPATSCGWAFLAFLPTSWVILASLATVSVMSLSSTV